jgi:hypothetical protein
MPRPRELLDVSSAGVARIRTAIEAARIKAQLAREESTRRRAAQAASKPLSIPNLETTKKRKNRKLDPEEGGKGEGEGDEEDQARLAASAAALERKAALYDELAARGGGAGAGEECSVDFAQKKRGKGRRGRRRRRQRRQQRREEEEEEEVPRPQQRPGRRCPSPLAAAAEA